MKKLLCIIPILIVSIVVICYTQNMPEKTEEPAKAIVLEDYNSNISNHNQINYEIITDTITKENQPKKTFQLPIKIYGKT